MGVKLGLPPILTEERRLRMLQNRMLRRIFGPKRDEVTGELRKLHNEELNDLYCSPNIVREMKSIRMRWAGHVARMGEGRDYTEILHMQTNMVNSQLFLQPQTDPHS